MTVPVDQKKPETMLEKERRIFREQLKRLGNCFLNKTFDLSMQGAKRRNQVITALFLIIGLISILKLPEDGIWGVQIRSLFQFFFNSDFMRTNPGTITQFFFFVINLILDPKNLRYLPVLVVPFIIGLQAAARYLADIFELKKIEIARDFIRQVALTGNSKSITIGNGNIKEKDKESPIYQIGGPGQVLVELDTAALFEKANGQPHVIGPGKAKLDGFERFRQAIDLRDQYTDPLEVGSRSLDGIRISTNDVRLLFSVYRGEKEPSAETPHPFTKESIEALVYGQASQVVLEGPYPSEPPTSWTGTIQGLIRGRLGGFMSKYHLAEYLASIGVPEIENARQREAEIVEVGKEVVAKDDPLEPRQIPPPPEFKARHIVSNLFGEFAKDFTKNAGSRGVQLSWIGVGTWKTPNEIVPERHIEAWRLSHDNLARGSVGALDSLKEESMLQQTLRLIKTIPLARFQQNLGKEHKHIVRELLLGYREQFIELIVLLSKSNKKVPKPIYAARQYIEDILDIKHWVGGTGSPSAPVPDTPSQGSGPSRPNTSPTTGVPSIPPVPPEEEDLYQDLFVKVGRDVEAAERLISYEQKKAPNQDRIEWIRRAIAQKIKDNRKSGITE